VKRAHQVMQRKLRPAMAARAAWVRAVREARDVAAHVLGLSTAAATPQDLAHLVRDLKAQAFPVGQASALALAEAFLASARALNVSTLVERREASASALAALAKALDDIIEADRGDAAARTWGRYSEL
jgi:hypothetical protein